MINRNGEDNILIRLDASKGIATKGELMQQKLTQLMEEYKISFSELAGKLSVSNHTLTKKFTGALDWTFPEIILLSELFHIEDPQSFFYDRN